MPWPIYRGRRRLLDRLFNYPQKGATAAESAAAADAATPTFMLLLLIFALLKLLVLSPLSLAMPTPTGVFLPTFVGGAAFGHLWGILMRRLLPAWLIPATLPGHFAVTGAAAMTTASTRTMSTAVVTIELTGQLSLQVPVLVATTTAYLVARLMDIPSLFDAFVAIKQLWVRPQKAYLSLRTAPLLSPLLPSHLILSSSI